MFMKVKENYFGRPIFTTHAINSFTSHSQNMAIKRVYLEASLFRYWFPFSENIDKFVWIGTLKLLNYWLKTVAQAEQVGFYFV